MKPKHQRLVFVSISLLFLCAAIMLTLRAFRDNLVFFYSPSELAQRAPAAGDRVRIGGLVEEGSVMPMEKDTLRFRVTDGKTALDVEYQGLPPALFREGQGVVAEGHMRSGRLRAVTLLAKHDEYYMPKEVVDALKQSSRWQGDNARDR